MNGERLAKKYRATNNVGPAAADLRKQVHPEGHASACPTPVAPQAECLCYAEQEGGAGSDFRLRFVRELEARTE